MASLGFMEIGLIAAMLSGSSLVPTPADGPMAILSRGITQLAAPLVLFCYKRSFVMEEVELQRIEEIPEN